MLLEGDVACVVALKIFDEFVALLAFVVDQQEQERVQVHHEDFFALCVDLTLDYAVYMKAADEFLASDEFIDDFVDLVA